MHDIVYIHVHIYKTLVPVLGSTLSFTVHFRWMFVMSILHYSKYCIYTGSRLSVHVHEHCTQSYKWWYHWVCSRSGRSFLVEVQ